MILLVLLQSIMFSDTLILLCSTHTPFRPVYSPSTLDQPTKIFLQSDRNQQKQPLMPRLEDYHNYASSPIPLFQLYSLSLNPPIEPRLLLLDKDNPSVPNSAAYWPLFGLFCRFSKVFLTFLSGLIGVNTSLYSKEKTHLTTMTGIGECETANRETDPIPGATVSSFFLPGDRINSPPRTLPHVVNFDLVPFVPTIRAVVRSKDKGRGSVLTIWSVESDHLEKHVLYSARYEFDNDRDLGLAWVDYWLVLYVLAKSRSLRVYD